MVKRETVKGIVRNWSQQCVVTRQVRVTIRTGASRRDSKYA